MIPEYVILAAIAGYIIGTVSAYFVARKKIKAAYDAGVEDGRKVDVQQIIAVKHITPELVKASIAMDPADSTEYCIEMAKRRLEELFGKRAVEMASFETEDIPEHCMKKITAALYMARMT